MDTPGIGEDAIGEEITNRLMSYLPNAVAFIYVINSSNSGGLQDDRACAFYFIKQIIANS